MMGTWFNRRDYKKYALEALIRAGAIQQTDKGKLYLIEDRASKLKI